MGAPKRRKNLAGIRRFARRKEQISASIPTPRGRDHFALNPDNSQWLQSLLSGKAGPAGLCGTPKILDGANAELSTIDAFWPEPGRAAISPISPGSSRLSDVSVSAKTLLISLDTGGAKRAELFRAAPQTLSGQPIGAGFAEKASQRRGRFGRSLRRRCGGRNRSRHRRFDQHGKHAAADRSGYCVPKSLLCRTRPSFPRAQQTANSPNRRIVHTVVWEGDAVFLDKRLAPVDVAVACRAK
jgi:hypothetical protein